jgi:hypothetical protein
MPTSDPNASYEVRRGTGVPVESADAGRPVGSTTGNSIVDRSVEAGCLYYYSVFAASDGLISPAAVSNDLLLHAPVSNLAIKAGNTLVSGSWTRNSPTGSVQVLRREAGLLKSFATPLLIRTSNDSFEDRNVVNGKTYEYNVTISYPLPGSEPIIRESGWVAAKPDAFSIGCGGWLAIMFIGFLILVFLVIRWVSESGVLNF